MKIGHPGMFYILNIMVENEFKIWYNDLLFEISLCLIDAPGGISTLPLCPTFWTPHKAAWSRVFSRPFLTLTEEDESELSLAAEFRPHLFNTHKKSRKNKTNTKSVLPALTKPVTVEVGITENQTLKNPNLPPLFHFLTREKLSLGFYLSPSFLNTLEPPLIFKAFSGIIFWIWQAKIIHRLWKEALMPK